MILENSIPGPPFPSKGTLFLGSRSETITSFEFGWANQNSIFKPALFYSPPPPSQSLEGTLEMPVPLLMYRLLMASLSSLVEAGVLMASPSSLTVMMPLSLVTLELLAKPMVFLGLAAR